MVQHIIGQCLFEMQSRRPRETQKVLDYTVEAAHLGAGDFEAAQYFIGQFIVAGKIFLQQLQLDIDGAEGVAHLMGDGGGEAAERRHLLRLPHAPFGPLQVGDFRECQQRAQGGGVVVGEVHRVNS